MGGGGGYTLSICEVKGVDSFLKKITQGEKVNPSLCFSTLPGAYEPPRRELTDREKKCTPLPSSVFFPTLWMERKSEPLTVFLHLVDGESTPV